VPSVSSWRDATTHRCRSKQTFGGAKDFCPNSPKLARKKLQKMTSKEKFFMWFWAPFFSHQSILGATFAHIFRDFVKVFRDFAQISKDFVRIFTRSRLLGVRLHSPFPHQCCNRRTFIFGLVVREWIKNCKMSGRKLTRTSIRYTINGLLKKNNTTKTTFRCFESWSKLLFHSQQHWKCRLTTPCWWKYQQYQDSRCSNLSVWVAH